MESRQLIAVKERKGKKKDNQSSGPNFIKHSYVINNFICVYKIYINTFRLNKT